MNGMRSVHWLRVQRVYLNERWIFVRDFCGFLRFRGVRIGCKLSSCGGNQKMAPSYANLFAGYIENEFFSTFNGPKPDLYKCFIDDCVCATSSSREELNQFITSVNYFHSALKYTWEISENSRAFLDIKLSVNGNSLSISVPYKVTDSHTNYSLHSSSHPQNVKNAIPFS